MSIDPRWVERYSFENLDHFSELQDGVRDSSLGCWPYDCGRAVMDSLGKFRPAPTPRTFDRAELKESGRIKMLTPEEFDALPMNVRVTALLSSRVRFFKGNVEVPANKAVK